MKYLLVLLGFFYNITADYCPCKYEYIEGGVTQAEKDLIVKEHNNYRKLIANGQIPGQPKGINLQRMHWDEKIADEAQIIADTCIYAHVKVNDNRWHVGQNLYSEMSSAKKDGRNWKAGMDAWFQEHKIYTYNTQFKRGTGHYTQMVWANTKYVGCGYSFYITNGRMKYEKFYVCNYGPGGNYIGQYPYQTGEMGCENLCES